MFAALRNKPSMSNSFATFRNDHPRLVILAELVLAACGTLLVGWTWERLQGRFPSLPPWHSEYVIAVLAIAFAVVQFLDARSEEAALKEQAGKMGEIASSMSTQFVGPFPENLEAIAKLTVKARSSLDVIVDYPGYGQFSALQTHLRYLGALTQHAPGVCVRVICYDHSLREKERLEQFPDTAFKDIDVAMLSSYVSFVNADCPVDCAGLRSLLSQRDEQILSHTSVLWKFHGEPAAFFLWLVDDAEAIFTFKNVGRKDVGLSFRTRDGKLLAQFKEIFKRRWERATPTDAQAGLAASGGHSAGPAA